MELIETEKAATHAQQLLQAFRKVSAPIIHVQHIATRPGSTFFLLGTSGAEIHPLVAPAEGENVVTKHFPNSFRESSLLDILKQHQIDSLVICGAMSHMCIDATTRAAFDLGFACTVAEDACATRNLTFKERVVQAADVHAAFMAALSVPYAKIQSTAEILQVMA